MAIAKVTLYCDEPFLHADGPKLVQGGRVAEIFCCTCLDNEGNKVLAMSGMGHLRVGETKW